MIQNEVAGSIHSFKYLLNHKELSLVETENPQIMRIWCDEYTVRCVYLRYEGGIKEGMTKVV